MTLALAPETCESKHVKVKDAAPLNLVDVNIEGRRSMCADVPWRFFLAPAASATTQAPLWYINEAVTNEEDAKMVWTDVVVQNLVACDVLGQCVDLAKAVDKFQEQIECIVSVRAPILLNKTALLCGDVLRVHVGPRPEVKRVPEQIRLEARAKKQRS